MTLKRRWSTIIWRKVYTDKRRRLAVHRAPEILSYCSFWPSSESSKAIQTSGRGHLQESLGLRFRTRLLLQLRTQWTGALRTKPVIVFHLLFSSNLFIVLEFSVIKTRAWAKAPFFFNSIYNESYLFEYSTFIINIVNYRISWKINVLFPTALRTPRNQKQHTYLLKIPRLRERYRMS